MADHDVTNSSEAMPYDPGVVGVSEGVLDCSEQNVDATETAKVIHVPANTLVLGVDWKVKKVEGGTLTIDIGDGSDDDRWLSAGNANTLLEGGSGTARYFADAGEINVLCNNNADTAVIVVKAAMVRMVDKLDSYT